MSERVKERMGGETRFTMRAPGFFTCEQCGESFVFRCEMRRGDAAPLYPPKFCPQCGRPRLAVKKG